MADRPVIAHVEGPECRPEPDRCEGPHIEPDYYCQAEAILNRLAYRTVQCDHGDRHWFCRSELEAEVASLLRKAAVARGDQ